MDGRGPGGGQSLPAASGGRGPMAMGVGFGAVREAVCGRDDSYTTTDHGWSPRSPYWMARISSMRRMATESFAVAGVGIPYSTP